MPATIFGMLGTASFVALFANVYKHGWHWRSVALGTLLTVLMMSLAVPVRRRTHRWAIRYWIALATVCGVGMFRFIF